MRIFKNLELIIKDFIEHLNRHLTTKKAF